MKRKKDSGIQRHRIWTREKGRNTEENKEREKLLKKQERKQRIPSTERIDETTRRNVNARQRQKEYTKERDTTTAETKDREN